MLPALVEEMQSRGCILDFTTYDRTAATDVTLSVRKEEANRLRKRAETKPESSPTTMTHNDLDDLKPWSKQKSGFRPMFLALTRRCLRL